jgi:uncharacterized protein YecE (DUF72 family)
MKKEEKVKKRSPVVSSPVVRPGLHVGTSGWSYGEWDQVFYPAEVKSTQDRLHFYSQHFSSVEVNYSFYHLPKQETYLKWAGVVPPEFLFTLKASRFITHIQKLQGIKESWSRFITNAQVLGNRLGPILFQFAPSFRADLKRLSHFLALLRQDPTGPIYPVFEFRHPSWFIQTTYAILREAGVSLCIAHSARYPCVEEITSDLVYYRFHGPEALFASWYSDGELRSWAKRIKPLLKSGKSIYIYFNNTLNGYAVENAKTLCKFIET